jgi:hypothetical protein
MRSATEFTGVESAERAEIQCVCAVAALCGDRLEAG